MPGAVAAKKRDVCPELRAEARALRRYVNVTPGYAFVTAKTAQDRQCYVVTAKEGGHFAHIR